MRQGCTYTMWSILVLIVSIDCDVTFTDTNGLVTSPNYPSSYPDHLNCRLSIQAPDDKIISLFPVTMDTERFRGRCVDKVDIYNGDTSDSQNRFSNDTFCGDVLSPSYTSSGTRMLITFTSDYGTSHSGFAFTYLVHSPQGKKSFSYHSLDF